MEPIDIEVFKDQVRAQVFLGSQKKLPIYQAVVEAARAEEQRRRTEQEKTSEVTDGQETPAE